MQLDSETVARIMTQKSGQKRINELFRAALCRVVGRATVATVAQQDDYMKRVRANGGARTTLQPEGILILGHYNSHAAIARELGIPVPGPGDTVSIRVISTRFPGAGVAQIRNRLWKVAAPKDPVVRAPDLPCI